MVKLKRQLYPCPQRPWAPMLDQSILKNMTLTPKLITRVAGAALLSLTLALPLHAKDPFRSTKARAIGNETSAAFTTLFRDGDYRSALPQIDRAMKANSNEPLAHTMGALVAFFQQDMNTMRQRGTSIKQTAQALQRTDKLRSHIYLAVADLVEASYLFKTEGISGVPKILPLIQNVLNELRTANSIDPEDPELNLLRGLIDILISSVSSSLIPANDVETSLTRLRQFSAPDYLRWGGVAVAYRDARQPAPALEAIDKALAVAPQNPMLHYFKGQIHWIQGNIPEAKRFYQMTLSRAPQLPTQFIKDVQTECIRLTGKAEECPVSQ